ncbi:hypothetical protein [Aquimarina sp. 2304DJ70-9]|uniref:hypothetical protein n=1 Tax=Aquimarina penaris TaxID=3231044 RepID=UPI0034635BBF
MIIKKGLWNLLLIVVLIGCSTDDYDSSELEMQNNLLTQKASALSYGMPIENMPLSTEKIIKITYHTNNPFTRRSIRQEFAEKYTETQASSRLRLVLVQPATSNTTTEYWYLHNYSDILPPTAGGTLRHPDDDKDLEGTKAPLTYYDALLVEISTHLMIDLFIEDNGDPFDNPFDPTDNPINPIGNPFNPTDRTDNLGGMQDRYQ